MGATRLSRKKPKEQAKEPVAAFEPEGTSLWHEPLVHVLLIVAASFAVYFNTIASPFLFDDITYLVMNPAIKDFSFFSNKEALLNLGVSADVKVNFILRPVSYFTYAVNFAVHGLDVRGYHLTNLIIHIGNGLLVYLLVSLFLRTPAMSTGNDNEASSIESAAVQAWLPVCCALLFVCHPLQTQAVTYIVQRFTSLVALFYLGCLVMYGKSRLSHTMLSHVGWYLLSLLAATLAMYTKENAFTLPLVVMLFELMFFTGHPGKRVVRVLPFLFTMAILPLNLSQVSTISKPVDPDVVVDSINLVNFSRVSSWHYLMTQFGVIVTYLRLLILPLGQNVDYDYHLQTQLLRVGVLLPLSLILSIMGSGIYLCWRSWRPDGAQTKLYKLAAFGIFWFFLTLSVESSIVPIDDLIFEHRAYLPSAGFFLTAVTLAAVAWRRFNKHGIFASKAAARLFAIIVICLSVAGIARNNVWKDKASFWRDVVEKSPAKARGHYALAIALMQRAALEQQDQGIVQVTQAAAINEFRTAIKLKPDFLLARVSLGKALGEQKQFDEATAELLTAVKQNPKSPLPHLFLGEFYETRGDPAKARLEYTTAIALDPLHPEPHLRMGKLYAAEGKLSDAIRELEKYDARLPNVVTQVQIRELKARLTAAEK